MIFILKRKKQPVSLAALLAAALFLTVSVGAAPVQANVTASASPSQAVITIVHTNDIHGRSAYQEGNTIGFEKLKAYLTDNPADLLLDAGDTFHGQAFATLEQGKSIAELMKAVGYDAMTPGNHDWNYGKDRLKELQEISNTPILAANIADQQNNAFFENDGALIKEADGVKIGVFGVFDQDIQADTAPRNLEGLTFTNDAAAANRMAESLRAQGCELVVTLTHQLYIDNFISQIHGVDLVIAGHEHAVIDESYPDADGKQVRVVEAGQYFQNAGVVQITFDRCTKSILDMHESLFTLEQAKTVSSDPGIASRIQSIQSRQTVKLEQMVGSVSTDLDGRWEELRVTETSLGRIVTAAYLEETGADVAFENAGGIRLGKRLPAGDIFYRDIIDIAPYGNYIVTKEVTGAELRSILEKSIDIGIRNMAAYAEWKKTGSDQVRWPDDNGSYLQFGGISVIYDPEKPMGERVQNATVKGQPLDGGKTYVVATNNYISQGTYYTELAGHAQIYQYSACDEALTRFVQQGRETLDMAAAHENLAVYSLADTPPSVPEIPPASGSTDNPQTGDSGMLLIVIVLALSSAGSFMFLHCRRREIE